MELQSKFLNKEYLDIRIKEFDEIKNKEFEYIIKESNRVLSKSLYVEFCLNNNGFRFKVATMRISDHRFEKCIHTQFIIDPFENLTKSKRKSFVRIVNNLFKKGRQKMLDVKLYNISKEC